MEIARDSTNYDLMNPDLGFWGDALNREQLLSKLASTLAVRMSRFESLARTLNRFAHERTRVSLCAGYLCAWRLHLRSLPRLLTLMQIRSQEEWLIDGLVIGPEYGLSLSLLLDSNLLKGTLYYSHIPNSMSIESRFFEANLRRCKNAERAIYAGPLDERRLSFNNGGMTRYDFFLFEGVRTSKRRTTSLLATEQIANAWRHLRVGGVAYIEGLRLRSNELNAEVWQPGPEAGIVAFLRAFKDTYTSQITDDFLTLEKMKE